MKVAFIFEGTIIGDAHEQLLEQMIILALENVFYDKDITTFSKMGNHCALSP